MALQDLWLEGIDVDAALYDIRDDDTQAWEVRALAGASIGIDPIAGLRAVIELSTAMERIVRGENDGKAQLASILGRAGDDYQRCLWYTVAGRDPLAVATLFGELEKLMAARAMLWVEADDRGLTPAKADNPYWTTRPEGPPATFSDRFELGEHWTPFLPSELLPED